MKKNNKKSKRRYQKPWFLINKKAQEEIMGFVIIVLVVMVIGLIFFAFSLRRSSESIEPKQAELDDLLQTAIYYTTECKINNQEQNIRELVRKCYNSQSASCDDNMNICNTLNNTIEKMFYEFLGQNIAQQVVHSYTLNISNSKQITYIEDGQLEGNYFGSSLPIATLQGEDVLIKLRFYYSKE